MDDLISRTEAIDDLHGKDPSQIWDTADIEVWVNALPSAQPEQRWIPCSERLPEEKGEYMVTVKIVGWNGKTDIALLSSRYTKTKGWHLTEGKVIAWMPLPEPYREDDHETN